MPSGEETFVDGVTEGRYGGRICTCVKESNAFSEFVVYCTILRPGKGAVENLPK